MRSLLTGLALLALLSVAALAQQDDAESSVPKPAPAIYDAVHNQFAAMSEGPLEKVEGLLKDIGGRLTDAQNGTQAQFVKNMQDYEVAVFQYNQTLLEAQKNRSIIDDHIKNVTGQIVIVRREYDSIDARVKEKAGLVAELVEKIKEGDEKRKQENLRYQMRMKKAKRDVMAIINIIDRLGPGDNEKEALESLKKRLNTEEAKKNTTGTPVSEESSLLEVATALQGDDFVEFRELLGGLHTDSHAMIADIQGVELRSSVAWKQERAKLNATRAARQEETDKIEESRAPLKEGLDDAEAHLLKLQELRVEANNRVEEYEGRLARKIAAKKTIFDKYAQHAAKREVQLNVVNKLQAQLEKHDGEDPVRTRSN